MAAKPADWRLMGVACGPREVDPKVHSADEWCAWTARSGQETAGGPAITSSDVEIVRAAYLGMGWTLSYAIVPTTAFSGGGL